MASPSPEGAPAEIEFGVLGHLVVTRLDEPITIDGIRRRALLIRLLMANHRPVPLGCLVEDLWGGEPPPGAPSTLRSHLSLLRKLLGATRLYTRNGAAILELRPGELDAVSFEAECERARLAMAEGNAHAASVLFEHSLGRWRGAALSDVQGFAWALPEIARLEEGRLEALEGLLESRLRLGDHKRVVAEAELAISERPLREQLWAILMSALYRSGRQADALRTYQRLRARLDEELGIEPSPTLRHLEQAILDQDVSLDWSAPPSSVPSSRTPSISPPSSVPAEGPYPTWMATADASSFVGRDHELDTARRARRRAVQGKQVLLVITGEPGIGKTRLTSEFATECAGGGDLVLYGRCDEEPLSSFQGFRQALRGIMPLPAGRTAVQEIGPLATALGQVVPEASIPPEPTADLGPSAAEAERFQSFEAVVAFLTALARTRPLVLVLEDLHWADAPTLSLLEHLLRSNIAAPLLIVATYRDTEADGKGWLSEGLVSARRTADVERVDLGGLSDWTSLALFQSSIGSAVGVDEASRSLLREYTGGNPFFLQEVALDILASGEPVEQRLSPLVMHATSVSDRLCEVVHWRLMKLSDPCKRILSVAALMGPQFQVGLVLASSGNDESLVLAVLDEARTAGIVTEAPDVDDSYWFVHDLVRQTLVTELGSSRRVRIHRRIAQVLEERFGSDPARAWEIALHYTRGIAAGSADRALFYSRLAGESALDHIAYESAVTHFQHAVTISADHFPDADDQRCELLLLLADAMVKSGQLIGADQRFSEAFEMGRRLDRVDVVASAALGYGGVLPAGAEPNETGQRLLRTALTELGHDDSLQRALVIGRLAQWGHFSQPRDERRSLGDEAVAVASRLVDAATIAACIEYRYWALCGPDEVDLQVEAARRIRELGMELGNTEIVLRGMKCELHAEFERGDFAVADQLARTMRDLAERVKQPEYLRLGVMWESLVAGIQGRFTDAEESATEAFAIFRRSGHPQTNAIAVGLSLTWLWLQGRMNELEPILEAGQTGRSSLGERAISAWIAVEAGRDEVAGAVLAGLTPEAVVAEDRNFHWWFTMAGLSHAACCLGDTDWATVLYGLISPFSSHFCRVGQATFLGSASFYLGRLARVAGWPDLAVLHLEDALARHRAMGATPFVELTKAALEDKGRSGGRDHQRQRSVNGVRRLPADGPLKPNVN